MHDVYVSSPVHQSSRKTYPLMLVVTYSGLLWGNLTALSASEYVSSDKKFLTSLAMGPFHLCDGTAFFRAISKIAWVISSLLSLGIPTWSNNHVNLGDRNTT